MNRVRVNGMESSCLSVDDRGLQYGDGLFETVAVAERQPQQLELHLQRLYRHAERLGIRMPDERLITNDIDALLQPGEPDRAVLKIIITRGPGGRGYRYQAGHHATRVCLLSAWPQHVDRWQSQGVRLAVCSTRLARQPQLAGIKTLNRLENILAAAELGQDTDEGIMLDTNDRVIEGTMSNVFAVASGEIVTPDLSQCGIEGIVRQLVIEAAAEAGVTLKVRKMTLPELQDAEEVFITNSLIGLCSAATLQDRHYNTTAMADKLRTLLNGVVPGDTTTTS